MASTLWPGQVVQLDVQAWDAGGEPYGHPFDVVWESADEAVATITADGRVTGHNLGQTEITASVEHLQAKAAVEVSSPALASITLSPEEATIKEGDELIFEASVVDASGAVRTDLTVEWRVGDASIAAIEVVGMRATVSGLKGGATTVSAESGRLQAHSMLTVEAIPARMEATLPPSMLVGERIRLEAKVWDTRDEELSGVSPIWSTETPDLLEVTEDGELLALSAGEGIVVATASPVQERFPVTIEPLVPTTVEANIPPQLTLAESQQLEAFAFDQRGDLLVDEEPTWASADPEILPVTEDGVLTAAARGAATITVSFGEVEASQDVEVFVPVGEVHVLPGDGRMFLGERLPFTTSLVGVDGLEVSDREVQWSSDQPGIIEIDASGEAVALVPGEARVRAEVEGVWGEAEIESIELEFTSIHVGWRNVCGLTVAGEVYCLRSSQDDSTWNQLTLIPSPMPLESLSLSYSHGCGLSADGTAYCVGSNDYGESGQPSLSGSLEFQAVDTTLRFQQIEAGGHTTCGIERAAGSTAAQAHCWGGNLEGQLGDGTTEDAFAPTPVQGPSFSSLALGHVDGEGVTICGVDEDGAGHCWGANDTGQLGNGSTSPTLTPTPVDIAAPLRSLAMASRYASTSRPGTPATRGHGCGVTTSSELSCWGENGRGELGIGTDTSTPSPTPVPGNWDRVWTSRSFIGGTTCALTTTGEAYCWGADAGQLGNGSPPSTTPALTPTPVGGGLIFQELDLGTATACGMTDGGKAYCWGSLPSGRQNLPTLFLGQR